MTTPDRHARPSPTRALLLALALLVALPLAGQAHEADSYYELRWGVTPTAGVTEVTIVLDWVFSPTFEQEARQDGLAAAQVWNDTATNLTFRHVGEATADPGLGSCPTSSIVGSDPNVARRGEIDGAAADGGGILALAALCPLLPTNVAYHFTVTYDEAEPWHFGPPPVPRDRFDLLGILAHEFGHATGWGRHFDESTGMECLGPARHTMCSTVDRGTDDPRSLEAHDIDTWQDAY